MKFIFVSIMLFFTNSAFAQSSFLTLDEAIHIEHKLVGNVEVLVLEDFARGSFEAAKIVATEGNFLLVERAKRLALLVPEKDYDAISENPFIAFAEGPSCQAQCGGSAVAGAIAGGLGGAAAGATTGGLIGTAGGPVGIGAGAAGGAVIGGGLGAIGGFIGGFESCRLQHCKEMEPARDPGPE